MSAVRLAAAVLVTALVAVVPAAARSDQGQFVNGSGNAYAQFVRMGPTAARLSLAPTLGLSLADYAGTVGRGQSTAADLAAIGVAQPCLAAQIPTNRVVSTDPGADKGKDVFFAGSRDASGNGGGIGELFARATTAPFGESAFRFGTFSIPGLITVGEGYARSTAGIVKGSTRQASATVEISNIDFGGGAVKLAGLHWGAVQETTDKGRKVTATFTVQSASAGGVPLPLPASGDLSPVLGPLNQALAPTGFAIKPPTNDSLSGVASMSPLSIQIINSAVGRQYLAPVLAAAQPVREPLSQQLISVFQSLAGPSSNNCGGAPTFPDLTAGVLVADLAIGIFSGSSDLHIELGGVSAYTEGERFNNPFFNALSNAPKSTGGVETIFKPGAPGTPGTPGQSAQLTTALPPLSAPKKVPGHTGGKAVAVGAAGLAAALLLAAADWFRMRSLHRAGG